MANPRKVPLGDGLAGRARSLLINRSRQIDEQVEKAVTGGDQLKIRKKKKAKKA